MGGGEQRARSPAVLDGEILDQLRRVGGEDLVRELMRLYTTHTPERMRRARRSLARGDLGQAAKAVHSLRSSSATLGAADLASALAVIEADAESGESEAVNKAWPAIEDRVASLLGLLEDRLAAP